MIDIIYRFRWPIAVVASVALVTWVVVAGFGDAIGIDETVQATVARAAAWVETVLLPPLIRLALRDEDGDGQADLFQRGTGLIVLIVALAVPNTGCSQPPALIAAEAGAMVREGINVGGEVHLELCSDTDEVRARPDPQAAAQTCLALEAGHEGARDSWILFRDAFFVALDADGDFKLPMLRPLIRPLLDAYTSWAELVRQKTGTVLPDPSALLGELL